MSEKESKFLMGDEFMLPDIILAHCGSWARSAKFPSENRRFNDYTYTYVMIGLRSGD
tara:strand:+ start:1342 stop:1512 length:171 start_codon:yes stop_codon:yes gene_type:complete